MSKTRRSRKRWRIPIITMTVAVVCCTACSGVAGAEELTRSEYVAKLEAECKPEVEEIERRVGGVRADVRDGRLKAAGKKFGIAAKIFGGSVRDITPIPRPKADRKKLATWFRYLRQQEDYMLEIADAFGHDRGVRGQRFIARFVHSGNQANNTVFGWGFNYCAFKFSRFG
jgi:hypothetical protein